MLLFRFRGNQDHVPMLWAIKGFPDFTYAVCESYDEGETWMVNTDFECPLEAVGFVESWFKSNDY